MSCVCIILVIFGNLHRYVIFHVYDKFPSVITYYLLSKSVLNTEGWIERCRLFSDYLMKIFLGYFLNFKVLK